MADCHLLEALLLQVSPSRYSLAQTDPHRAAEAMAKGNYQVCLLDFADRNPHDRELLEALQGGDGAVPIILLVPTAEAGIAALPWGGADYWDRENLSASLIERSLRLVLGKKQGIATVEAELHSSQQALKLSEQRLHSIFSSLEDALWSIDPRIHKLLYLNSAVEDIYGRTLSEFFENLDLWRLTIHPEDRERVFRADRALGATQKFDIDYRILRPDGEVRWLRERTRLIEDEQGRR